MTITYSNHPLLSIIIVNWNTADLLINCLASILKNVTLDIEMIVVDNDSDDDSVSRVNLQFPQVRLIVQSENVGYSQGNNIGMAAANGRYLLLLNPDTEVMPGAIEVLIQFMDMNPQTGIAGPTLWNPDGSLQPSTFPLPSLWIEFLRQTMLFRLFPTQEQKAALRNDLQQVENITGAAMCIRRKCYEQIGPLDPEIFMFYEDADWCKRAKDAGWQIWFVPCAGVMHVKAAASSRFARTRTLLDSQRSVIYYFRKHGGAFSVAGLRVIALCGGLARSVRAGLKWLLGRDRPDQRARLRAYGYMILWSLTGRGL